MIGMIFWGTVKEPFDVAKQILSRSVGGLVNEFCEAWGHPKT